MLRSIANRLGAALIVVGLLISSALMARVDHTVALVGFVLSGVLGLYMLWRILRTPGSLRGIEPFGTNGAGQRQAPPLP